MRDRVLAYIRRHELMKPGDRIGAAVSGGADSVALLRILVELRHELGIVLSVLHFNHKIRAEAEADADERFVAALAREHELEFHRSEADVPEYAREHKLSLETAARKLRYDYFRSLLSCDGPNRSPKFDSIATAHTLNDQAETVLMRLIRGAGTKGLAGIYPRQCFSSDALGSVIRPMLCVERNDIEALLQSINQPWREDASNLDPKHRRNRVRHQLLPALRRDFNPGILTVLSDVAEIARAEEDYFGEVVSDTAAVENTGSQVRLRISVLLRAPLAIQRRIVRRCADILDVNLDFQHVEQVLRLAASSEGDGRCDLPGDWVAVRSRGEITFDQRAEAEPRSHSYEYPLPLPGKVHVPEIGTVVAASIKDGNSSSLDIEGRSLDPSALGRGLTVRNWRPGDRFWPAHTKTPKKLKELLQRDHIPARDRARWPVVTCGDVLLWVRGFESAATLIKGNGSKHLVIEETPVVEGN